DEQVVAASAGEIAGGQADRLLQGGDHRGGGASVQSVQSGAGAEAAALQERVLRVIEEDGDIAAGLVADSDVGQAIAVDVRHADVRGGLSGRQGQRCAEGAVGLLEGDLDAVVEGVGHDEVVEPVAGEVCGGDACGQSGGGEGGAAVDAAVGGDAVD